MKKFIIIIGIIFAMVLMIVLVSCNSSNNETTNQELETTIIDTSISESKKNETTIITIVETTRVVETTKATEVTTIMETTTIEETTTEMKPTIKEIFVSCPTSLDEGEIVSLNVTNDLGDMDAIYKYESSDEGIVYVSEDGVVTAIKAGDAQITITCGDVVLKVDFHVCQTIIMTVERPIVVKPVIYIYPDEETDITIKYDKEDNLITTYPKYQNGWSVHVKKDGTIIDTNGREYYALFYDEDRTYNCTFEKGFYVNKENAISFLEEKIDYLGFTNREADEFIMYWLPILEKNGHSLVYFELTEERNQNAPLSFSVNVDSMLRVIIHVKAIEDETIIEEQELHSFERHGTTIVEWGGSIY